MEKQRIRYSSASDPHATLPLTRAPNSVFDTAPRAPQVRRDRSAWPVELQVKYDKPLPSRTRPDVPKPYDAALEKMEIGSYVDGLTEVQARSMQKRGRTLGIMLERRRIEGANYGVWRVAEAAPKRAPTVKRFPNRVG